MAHWESSGQSDEWYTPRLVFDALGTDFDIDVAPARHGTSHVPAATGCWRDGLAEDWTGFVWMNPPFGGRNSLAPWLDKFFAHGNGVALTPDRTSAPWFQSAWRKADAVLFTPKLRFLRPDGSEGKSPSNGTALWAAGDEGCAALDRAAAAGLGVLALPHPSHNARHDDADRLSREGARVHALLSSSQVQQDHA